MGIPEDFQNQHSNNSEDSSNSKDSSDGDKETITYTRRRNSKKNSKHSPICRDMVDRIDHPSDDPTPIGSASSRTCCCGAHMIKTGETSVTKLEYIPAHFEEHVYHVPLYKCPNCCADVDQPESVLPDALSQELLPTSRVTNELLAQIVFNKFACYLPLYRQSMIFSDLGVYLSRSTMSSWIIDAAMLCESLYDEILNQIRLGSAINMDETKFQVMKEPGRKNTQLSRLWHMAGGRDGACRYFYYSPTRRADVAAELVGNFKGGLQTDGYSGYNALGNREGIIHVGCLDHIRRKFIEVHGAEGTMEGSISQQVLDEIAKIYHIEKVLRAEELDSDEFQKKRMEQVKPILDGIKATIDKMLPLTPASSRLGKAFAYAKGQWLFLCNYLKIPEFGPSNQLAENGIRPFVVGRKNFLFAGHPNGAKALSIMYSLIETAKANDIRPLSYLIHVFSHIRSTPKERIGELLPWNCDLK